MEGWGEKFFEVWVAIETKHTHYLEKNNRRDDPKSPRLFTIKFTMQFPSL